MLLVCDIGNTRVHLGLYRGESLIRKLSFSGQKVIDYEARWNELFEGLDPNAVPTDTVVCSVNPKAKIPFTHYVNQRVGVRPLVVGETVPYPIPVLLDDPAEVGPDRVVNGYAAFALLGGGPLVVCDFGTAITLDVIDE
ncbi:MAG: type III pantothenate kinase, partial [Planctomycetota bacterium]